MKNKQLLETREAAAFLRRATQTLRQWASNGKGPIQPIRINGKGGRLLWRLSDLEKLIGEKISENELVAE